MQAFQAHDVLSQQIPRLMPEGIRLKPQDVASADILAEHLRLEHLDWASDILALRRDWLDLEGSEPHHGIEAYKDPAALHHWLKERSAIRGDRPASIHVLGHEAFGSPSDADGRFAVIYEEAFGELGEKTLSRYWHISHGLRFDHAPCVTDLLCTLALAEHFHLRPIGHVVPRATTAGAQKKTLGLIPNALRKTGGWRLQDWVPVRYDAANCQDRRHRLLWEEACSMLEDKNLGHVIAWRRPGCAAPV